MRLIKKVIVGGLTLLLITSLGGLVYFRSAFKAPRNLSHVAGVDSSVGISWQPEDFSAREGLYIPVTLPYAEGIFYMQFDLGAVYSVLYNTSVQSIRRKNGLVDTSAENYVKDFSVKVGGMDVKFDSILNLDYGKELDFQDTVSLKVIGTLGADFAENVKMILDFKKNEANFFFTTPDSLINHPRKINFEFKERKVLLPAVVDGEEKLLMWDTGASAYDLITSKKNWLDMASNPDRATPHDANQLKRKLKVYTAQSSKKIVLGPSVLDLKTVTYVEGFPWYIELAMQFSGMEGMIGNALFADRVIYLDPKDGDFILF